MPTRLDGRGPERHGTSSGESTRSRTATGTAAAPSPMCAGTRSIDSSQAGRRLSVIVSHRPLRLVPLDDAPTQKRLGLDGGINFSKEHPITQRWSLALHTWLPEDDGIRYLFHHAGEQRNYCLFLDRCGADLRTELQDTLGELRVVVHGNFPGRGRFCSA